MNVYFYNMDQSNSQRILDVYYLIRLMNYGYIEMEEKNVRFVP